MCPKTSPSMSSMVSVKSILKSGYVNCLTIGYDREDVIRLYCQELDTPIGKLLVAGSGVGICRICFPGELSVQWFPWFDRHFSQQPEKGSQPVLNEALGQLTEYFEGKRRAFHLPLDLRGTPFQLQVWRELGKIPYGSTDSYGQIARRIRNPRAGQAVGAAVGKNPVPIIVPCHRVMGHNGALVGFGGGLQAKEKLLELEGARIPFRGP